MYRALLALALVLAPSCALAQGCGPQNPNCVVPNRPDGDSGNPAANTRFVTRAINNAALVVDVRKYGVKCDGSTNDSAAFQAAIDANPGKVLAIPMGVCLATNLVINQPETSLVGAGFNSTQIIRPPNSPDTNCMVAILTNQVMLEDILFDGNKANQTQASNSICLVNGTWAAMLNRIWVQNSKAVAGGFGGGVVFSNSEDGTHGTFSQISNSMLIGNDGPGVGGSVASNVRIVNNTISANNCGIAWLNFVFPPVDNTELNSIVSGNSLRGNTSCGFSIGNAYIGGTASLPIASNASKAARLWTITGNYVAFNQGYGGAFYGEAAAVSGNTFAQNGVPGCAGNACGGFNSTSQSMAFTGNTLMYNAVWGADIGGSGQCAVSGNTFTGTQVDGSVDLNLGGSFNCNVTGNTFTRLTAGTGVMIFYLEGGGNDAFVIGTGTKLEGNIFDLSGQSGALAINSIFNPNVSFYNNHVVNSVVGTNPFRIANASAGYIRQHGNFDASLATSIAAGVMTVPSAATLLIPDLGDEFYVSGTTNIGNVLTSSQNGYATQVNYVAMTNQGTGYTQASPPTVTFSGGTCTTQPVGTARVKNDGRVLGVDFSNNGNCTVAPNATFAGGAGTGAAGTPALGSWNQAEGRQVTLIFLQAGLIISNGPRLALSSSHTVAAGSILVLRGVFSGAANFTWKEERYAQ